MYVLSWHWTCPQAYHLYFTFPACIPAPCTVSAPRTLVRYIWQPQCSNSKAFSQLSTSSKHHFWEEPNTSKTWDIKDNGFKMGFPQQQKYIQPSPTHPDITRLYRAWGSQLNSFDMLKQVQDKEWVATDWGTISRESADSFKRQRATDKQSWRDQNRNLKMSKYNHQTLKHLFYLRTNYSDKENLVHFERKWPRDIMRYGESQQWTS